jgi:hypothetical protein
MKKSRKKLSIFITEKSKRNYAENDISRKISPADGKEKAICRRSYMLRRLVVCTKIIVSIDLIFLHL